MTAIVENRPMLPDFIARIGAKAAADWNDDELRATLVEQTPQWRRTPLDLPHDESRYTRTCVYRCEDFEVLLLRWPPGSVSQIHDHGGQRCWFTVLEGALRVDDYARLDRGTIPDVAVIYYQRSQIYSAGGVDARKGRFDLHRVANAGTADAVSLHVYARPLDAFLVYDPVRARCRSVESCYDLVLDVQVPSW